MFVQFRFFRPVFSGNGTMDEIKFGTVSSTLPASCVLTDHSSICQVQFQPEKDQDKALLFSCGPKNQCDRVGYFQMMLTLLPKGTLDSERDKVQASSVLDQDKVLANELYDQ